jgi:hypothetical protein
LSGDCRTVSASQLDASTHASATSWLAASMPSMRFTHRPQSRPLSSALSTGSTPQSTSFQHASSGVATSSHSPRICPPDAHRPRAPSWLPLPSHPAAAQVMNNKRRSLTARS